MRYCFEGKIAKIQQQMDIFGAKPVVDAVHLWNQRCIHVAAESDEPNIITLLIEKGSEIDPKDVDGKTPLRIAILRKKYSSITTLIRLGASLGRANEKRGPTFRKRLRIGATVKAIAKGKKQRLAGEKERETRPDNTSLKIGRTRIRTCLFF